MSGKIVPWLVFLCLASGWAAGQPYGIDTRAPNTQLEITELPSVEPGAMQAVRVFPQLSFNQSVLLVDPLDGTQRLFLVTQSGVIYWFPNTTDPAPGEVRTFLDLSGKVYNSGEMGLLGLAFDPDFASRPEFYVYYNTSSPLRSTVSRFTLTTHTAESANPATEEALLQVDQPYSNHNGGMVAFGPDGMLYIGLGDGGSGGDPQGNGQNPATLLGSILRIDVRGTPDAGLGYAIPPDNPFVSAPPTANARREIYAYGLRNPYRFSFDRQTGFLYAGDVGQNAWEEIDIIESGRNYGWNLMEATHPYPSGASPPPNIAELTRPIAEYSHSSNGGHASVTGGYVCYGSGEPQLYGVYIFGDYVSRRIFGLQYDGVTTSPITTLANSTITVTGFGQDASGEVYALDYYGGIYVLRAAGGGGASSFPTRLSDLPALLAAGSGAGHTVSGVIPYAPSATLWSDGALKERCFALPDYAYAGPGYAQMTYHAAGGWGFPNGSALVKNFLLPADFRDPAGTARRIETRLLLKLGGEWHGFSYEWNEAGTDAELLTAGKKRAFNLIDAYGNAFAYEWQYPSRGECMQCHTAAANFVLGLNTPQMNTAFAYPASGVTDNQLRTYDHIGLFAAPLPGFPDTLPRMPDALDTNASTAQRARAYLAANCSMCHQPGATAPTEVNFRWEVADENIKALDVDPLAGDMGIAGAKIVKRGLPAQSVMVARMTTLDPAYRMPPLATSRVDTEAARLMRQWIIGMVYPAPWSVFADTQEVAIAADGHFYVGVYDYTGLTFTGSVEGFADTALSFMLARDGWYGIFLYDYTQSRWSEAFFVYRSQLN